MFGKVIIGLFLLSAINIGDVCLCDLSLNGNVSTQSSILFLCENNKNNILCKQNTTSINSVANNIKSKGTLIKSCFSLVTPVRPNKDIRIIDVTDLPPPIA